jgi:hypothetical protein
MATEWLIIAVLAPTLGHFETVRPLWTRIARWLVCFDPLAARRQRRFRSPRQAVPVVHRPDLPTVPAEVLHLEVGVAQHANKGGATTRR